MVDFTAYGKRNHILIGSRSLYRYGYFLLLKHQINFKIIKPSPFPRLITLISDRISYTGKCMHNYLEVGLDLYPHHKYRDPV